MALTKVGKEGITGISNSSDATAITINSSEQVGIGTTSVSNKLEVHSGDATNIVAKSTNGNGGYLNYSGLSSGGTTTFSVTHNGKIYVADGIQLGGTGAANYLGDYEEGTWTPALTGLTLTTALGNYTKIGQIVHWGFRVVLPATTANTHFSVTGLPFSHSLSNDYRFGGALIYANCNIGADVTCIVVGNAVQFYKNGSSFVEYGDYNAKDVRASGSYITTD